MSKKTLLIIIFLVLLIGYFGWLGIIGLRAEEPRRALVSIEMMENGDYVMPHLLGWAYYNKPPLFNWVMIICFKLFGSFSEWVVRLPSVISLFVLAFLNWKIVKQYINKEVALLSSLFFLTSADILFYGSMNAGEIDLFYTFLVYLNITAIFIFLEKEQYLRLFALSYFLAGLGFMTKGIPSLAFQGLTIVTALIWYKKIRLLFSWKHLTGILIFILVAGGYVYLIYLKGEHTGFIVRQIKEASQRTGIESDATSNLLGIVTTPLEMIKILIPWSLFMIALFMGGIKKNILSNRFVIFSLLFITVNFPLYWLTGEFRGRYVYPFIPFMCIVLAFIFHKKYKDSPLFRKIFDKLFGGVVILFPIVLFIAFFVPELKLTLKSAVINGILVVSGILLVYFYIKNSRYRIYAVILLLALSKIGINNIYMKLYMAESQTTHYKNHVARMLDITNGKRNLYDWNPYIYNSTIHFAGSEFLTQEVIVPPIISYQIPYYYALSTKKLLIFKQQMDPGNYYLVMGYDLHLYPGEILHEFRDLSTHHDWYLVRPKEN